MILLLMSFALKSLLIAGLTLGLLQFFKQRSAAQRSAIAHAGLIILLLMPAGEALLPRLTIHAPPAETERVASPVPNAAAVSLPRRAMAQEGALAAAARVEPTPPVQWSLVVYAIPVLLLAGLTLLALIRLFALRAKAIVLVEPTWLSAMAHAQRRMGFKHGTALLTSSDLTSPISWGLLRPVILLNDEALQATAEAEAIIAHELAHVERLDWAKLVIARLATALHWFNPFAWVLAKEAHQLREETADDAVLAANIECTDYAQLLVGIARHECKGLLLGAHGVAPGKDSLKRRVSRVLDSSVPRGPGARGFFAGVAVSSLALAAPLAALTVSRTSSADALPLSGSPTFVNTKSASLPVAVVQAMSQATSQSKAVARLAVETMMRDGNLPTDQEIQRVVASAQDVRAQAQAEVRSARAQGRIGQQAAMNAKEQARAAQSQADEAADRAIELRALAIDPAAMRAYQAALPGRHLEAEDYAALRATNVTPQFIIELRALGFGNADIEDLAAARSVGVTGDFARRMRQQYGPGLSIDRLIQLRALGGEDHRDWTNHRRSSVREPATTPPASPRLPAWIREGRPPPGIAEPTTDDAR